MTKIADAAPAEAYDPVPARDGDTRSQRTAPRVRARVWFWVRRYLPAEVVGTLSALLVGLAVFAWSASPILTAVAATYAESVGFYAVLAVVVYREQRYIRIPRRQVAVRTVLLLVAEFGPAEIFDTVFLRPAAISLAVWVMGDPFWALLVGKLAADVVFYAIAAGSFTLTARTGLRGIRRREKETTS